MIRPNGISGAQVITSRMNPKIPQYRSVPNIIIEIVQRTPDSVADAKDPESDAGDKKIFRQRHIDRSAKSSVGEIFFVDELAAEADGKGAAPDEDPPEHYGPLKRVNSKNLDVEKLSGNVPCS